MTSQTLSHYSAQSPTQGAAAGPWLTSALLSRAGQLWKVPGWGWGWQAGGAGVLESCMFSWIRKEDVVDRRHPSAHPFKNHPLPPTPTHYLTPQSILRGKASGKIALPVKGTQSGQQMRGNRAKMNREVRGGIKKCQKVKNDRSISCNDRGWHYPRLDWDY